MTSPNVTILDLTALANSTVGQLVAERPGRARIFEAYGIDYCCQGGKPLADACAKHGVELGAVLEQLAAEGAGGAEPSFNPATLAPHELADYIVETHHGYLRRELPRLTTMAGKVVRAHGEDDPSLKDAAALLDGVVAELTSHMLKEEQILFPAVSAMSRGESGAVRLDGPILCMMHEHDEVGAAMGHLRELTHGFRPPDDACNTYRAWLSGLAELEEDLHRHIHLENSVLFPAAQALANAS